MLNQDYTAKLLNLEDVIIKNVENKPDQLFVEIELPRKAHICTACGKRTDIGGFGRMRRETFLTGTGNTSKNPGIF